MGQNEKIVGTFEIFTGVLLIALTLSVLPEFSELQQSLSPRIYIAFVGALMGRSVYISHNEKPEVMSAKVPFIGGLVVSGGLIVSGYVTLPDSLFRPVISALVVSFIFYKVFSLIEEKTEIENNSES